MTFSFGLGTNNMLSQYQKDTSAFKLSDIADGVTKYQNVGAAIGQAGVASTFVDYTSGHLNRLMQQDQKNDNGTTFLFEYQALLRSRMQQMITELTAALTRDLDRALTQTRGIWDTENVDTFGRRQAAQGYTSDLEDAGAARVAYSFMTGFAQGVNPAGGTLGSAAYIGQATYDARAGGMVNKVSPDTTADALFFRSDGASGDLAAIRVFGTGTIQQSFAAGVNDSNVVDELIIQHRFNDPTSNVLYGEVGGGFITHENRYKFLAPEGNTGTASRFNAQNIFYLNRSLPDNVGGSETGNMNDQAWGPGANFGSDIGQTPEYQRFNASGNAKNEFQRVLYDTIFELDQRNLLRDIFRLSEKNGFFTNVQIASTSSLTTGSQAQASIFLNFVPADADRPDLGGSVLLSVDRFSAFFHS